MITVKCDKCENVLTKIETVLAYSDAKKVFVRICYLCTDDLTGYKLTFDARRKLGENLPKGVRA